MTEAQSKPTSEIILDSIYEAMDELTPENNGWGYSFYPSRDTWEGPAELYFNDPNGTCWQILVREHPHA